MRSRVHAVSGTIGFLTILVFWFSTVAAEVIGSPQDIAGVKAAIVWGLAVLIPALAVTGATGMSLGGKRTDPRARRKMRRMPIIALNGLVVLVPCAVFLSARADAGLYDGWFVGVQAIELVAGAANLLLMGRNIGDGLVMSGRLRPRPLAGRRSMN